MIMKPKYPLSLTRWDLQAFLLILLILFISSSPSLSHITINNQKINKTILAQNQTNTTTIIDPYLGYVRTQRGVFPNGGEAIELDNQNHAIFIGSEETELYQQSEIFYGKINLSGGILWKDSWKKNSLTKGSCLAIDKEHNRFFICGQTSNNLTSLFSLVIVCLNSETGEELWNRTYTSNLHLKPTSSLIVNNSLFIFGSQYNYEHWEGDSEVFLGCYNTFDGTEQWFRIFDSDFYDEPIELFLINDSQKQLFLCYNRYLSTENPNKFHTEFFIQKLFMNGSQIWVEKLEVDGEAIINDILLSQENDTLFLVGELPERNGRDTDGIILAYSLNGELINQEIFGVKNEEEKVFSIVVSSQNEIIVGGIALSHSQNDKVAFLATFNRQLQLLSFNRIERYLKSYINDLTITSEGKIFLTGFCQTDYDFFIYSRLLTGITFDSDRDNLADPFELLQGTDPYNQDSDGDGWTDGEEYKWSTDPLNHWNNPDTRNFWKKVGLALFIVLIVGFFLTNFIVKVLNKAQEIDQENSDKKRRGKSTEISPIVSLFFKIKNNFTNNKTKKKDIAEE